MDRKRGQCRHKNQRGAVAIMFAVTLMVMLGIIGIAIDTAMLYNRRSELQNIANATALAAASQLNGTAAGIGNALDAADDIAQETRYHYNNRTIPWNDAAIEFGTAPDGPWVDAATASAAPNGLLFARVNTEALDSEVGTVNTIFMQVFSSALAEANLAARAVAGRDAINVTPLAICAMSNQPAAARTNPGPPVRVELVEFGFRRGVGYDLMNLNPAGTAGVNFVISPLDPPGTAGAAANTLPASVEPFICTGTMSVPRVMGGPVTVASPFPLAALFGALNSRFDQYAAGGCDPDGAPPDANVRAYVPASVPWMNSVPEGQTARARTEANKLWTVADPLPAPTDNTAPMYGPLWTYARAVPFASYTPGVAEPYNGYSTFGANTWSSLYLPGAPVASGYPTYGPYAANNGGNFLAPSIGHRPGVRKRRVLNVPLLECPVPAGANVAANVVAIGRFFMTVPATATTLSAEFAGIVPEQSVGGTVELFR